MNFYTSLPGRARKETTFAIQFLPNQYASTSDSLNDFDKTDYKMPKTSITKENQP